MRKNMYEKELLALGFEEVVEEKKDDWKLDLYESLEGLFSKGLDELEEFLAFRKKLETHIPKQKKVTKEHVIFFCSNDEIMNDEAKIVIKFLKAYDLLEE